jgi:hypothetical protein
VASDADICNMALAHLGADSRVSSIDPPDGTVEASYCAIFYKHVRRAAIESGSFDFTLKRVALAHATVNPSNSWTCAYVLPSDCLNPLRVLRYSAFAHASGLYGYNINDPYGLYGAQWDGLFTERGSSEFEVENGILLTHEPDAILKYKADVTDRPGDFPPALVLAMSMLLAGYLAGPLIKGEQGRAIGQGWLRAGMAAIKAAAAADGNNRTERAEHTSAFLLARR